MARPKAEKPRSEITNVRLTKEERAEFESAANKLGYNNISEYIRHLHTVHGSVPPDGAPANSPAEEFPATSVRTFHETRHGEILLGDSRGYLFNGAVPESVDLIVTSPPFGLVRKKSYGNEDADDYCEWFISFAEGFRRVLKDNGSLVIHIGGSWIQGAPTRSLYHFKLLMMLVEEFGFHLCQEHYSWNPSKLPAPAEWVNVRRVRVKDAVDCIWWLSKTPFPKANNRRILQPYSESMKNLLKHGYTKKLRPSGHDISDHFRKDNGGAVPPNLLAIANTESNGQYQNHCRQEGLTIHPARFPAQVPEYFIRFLTNPGDLVVDPFAGSCVTGMVAENLERQWVCCELSEEYLNGAMGRFLPALQPMRDRGEVAYRIAAPCSMAIDSDTVPLFEDGGARRSSSPRAGSIRDHEPNALENHPR